MGVSRNERFYAGNPALFRVFLALSVARVKSAAALSIAWECACRNAKDGMLRSK
jgi:hypothetical protein